MNRTTYHRDYRRRNAARLNRSASHRRIAKYWVAWLLANLEWPVEPTPEVPRRMPLRRSTLRLAR